MKTMIVAVAITLLAAGASYAADEVEVRRVLVVDKRTKPSVAAQKARYQYVPTKVNDKANPDLLCNSCMKKVESTAATSKPSTDRQAALVGELGKLLA